MSISTRSLISTRRASPGTNICVRDRLLLEFYHPVAPDNKHPMVIQKGDCSTQLPHFVNTYFTTLLTEGNVSHDHRHLLSLESACFKNRIATTLNIDNSSKGKNMKAILVLVEAVVLTTLVVTVGNASGTEVQSEMSNVFEFTMKSLDGERVDLERYRGKVILIVNVASECGYTYQYQGLQNLHTKYALKGLAVLGFPSNDFGKQEPGTMAQIKDFCQRNYGVEFDMFFKIVVRGPNKVPLYDFLTSNRTNAKSPGEVDWNFEKFLIGRDGEILNRFHSAIEPESTQIIQAIESALSSR